MGGSQSKKSAGTHPGYGIFIFIAGRPGIRGEVEDQQGQLKSLPLAGAAAEAVASLGTPRRKGAGARAFHEEVSNQVLYIWISGR